MTTGNPSGDDDRSRDRQSDLMPLSTSSLGKYTLVGKLGHGGMAEVHLAYATGLGGFRKLCVIKMLHERLQVDTDFLNMFLDEARISARLNHPNVIQTYEVDAVEGICFIAMEYLEGQNLDRLLHRCRHTGRPLSPFVIAWICAEALGGLHYAHTLEDFDGKQLEIIHRDVTPQNLFVTYEGEVKLLDFGVAKAATHVVETKAGVLKGKYSYMAPEVLRGEEIDARSDLWSMGVILWEALAGERLFAGGDHEVTTLFESLAGDVPDLRDRAPDVPDRLVQITSRALAREPDARYQSAADMRDDLKQFLADGPTNTSREDVGQFMTELFADIVEKNSQVLKHCLSDTEAQGGLADVEPKIITRTSSGELCLRTPTSAFEPGAFAEDGSHASVPSLPAFPQDASAAGRPASSRGLVWLLLILLPVLGGGLYWGLQSRGDEAAPPPAATASPQDASTTERVPEPPPPPSLVLVRLNSSPLGAEVLLRGESLGRTPLLRELEPLPRGTKAAFVFRLAGHRDVTVNSPLTGGAVTVEADLARAQVDAGAETASSDEPTTSRRRRPAGRRREERPAQTAAAAPPPPEPPPPEPPPPEPPPRRPMSTIIDDTPASSVPIID